VIQIDRSGSLDYRRKFALPGTPRNRGLSQDRQMLCIWSTIREVVIVKSIRIVVGIGCWMAVTALAGCANRNACAPYPGYPQYQAYPYAGQPGQPGQPIQGSPMVGTPPQPGVYPNAMPPTYQVPPGYQMPPGGPSIPTGYNAAPPGYPTPMIGR
jgi:hypothetical protein